MITFKYIINKNEYLNVLFLIYDIFIIVRDKFFFLLR